jgi:integrase/recombinase XerD
MVVRDITDLPITSVDLGHVSMIKQKVLDRGAGEARLASIIYALKSFLRYCKETLELEVIDYKKIKPPKRPRKEVLFLSNEEIQQFIGSIKLENEWKGTTRGKYVSMEGLRFRTLVEALLGTGMRISEALSLNRNSIDFEKKEAKIIGKGNKERIVFFNDRALQWVQYYLEQRQDDFESLFITNRGTRLSREDISGQFRRYGKKSGINKKITPHILRHTTATNLLFNGCPIAHIKEILGHDRLETTCKYYLGIDKRKAKEAHHVFLKFDLAS